MRQHTADYGSQGTGNGPGGSEHGIVNWALTKNVIVSPSNAISTRNKSFNNLPSTEQITHTDLTQNNQTSAAHTLDHSPADEHGKIISQGTYKTPSKEQHVRDQDDKSPAPYVADFTP